MERISRNKNKTRVVLFFCVIAFALFYFFIVDFQKDDLEMGETSFFAMDTYMEFTAYGEEQERTVEALRRAEEKIIELEQMWSVTKKESEIQKINRNAGGTTRLTKETEELITFSLDMAERTDGALDLTLYPVIFEWGFTTGKYKVPTTEELEETIMSTGYENLSLKDGQLFMPEGFQIDLGAVAKGYSGEMAAEILKEGGIRSAILNLGGNVQTVGKKPDGTPWNVGIRSPYGEGTLGVLKAEDVSVITSGGYERYFTAKDGKTY